MGEQRAAAVLLVLAFLGFAAIGLPDGLLGVAVPSIVGDFGIAPGEIGVLLATFMVGYLVASFASGRLLARFGVGSVLVWSCVLTGASLLGYATAPCWAVMLAWSPLGGLGAGAIDAGINTYAATRHGVRTLNWLHACYGVGVTLGPLLLGVLFAAGQPWTAGYALVGTAQLALGVAFAATRTRWPPPAPARTGAPVAASVRGTLRAPRVLAGVATFTTYTGIEAAAGVWAYSLFTTSRGVAESTAAAWVAAYWASFTVGRVLLGPVAERMLLRTFLRGAIATMVAGAALLWLAPGALGPVGLMLLGIGCAPVFPSLMAATPARVGAAHAPNAIGFQVCGATVGQSALPALVGTMAAHAGFEVLGPVLCAASVLLFVLHETLGRVPPG
ncbi:MAG: MFS transporter [bacterium]|nr:MFS transporter [bacterium]